MPPQGLRGKIAVVTGVSRPRSIGAAVCRIFASCGVDIFFTHWLPFDTQMGYDTGPERVAALVEELRGAGVRVEGADVDLSLVESPRRVMDLAIEHLGAPSILVNNAAYGTDGQISDLDAAVLDTHYAVNIRGMVLLTAEFVRRWSGGRGGRIINLTSGQSVGPMPGVLAYATTKGAVEAFTTSLAADVAALGITVNAVDPGATDTGWMSEEMMADIAKRMGMGRVGQPEDAARLIAFLASDASEWITGQVIHSRGA
jgi:3-oxoacyl-[acyl-carrier protein] reductase